MLGHWQGMERQRLLTAFTAEAEKGLSRMSDFAMVKACAKAIGLRYESVEDEDGYAVWDISPNNLKLLYSPLTDDKQAMYLVKRFDLVILKPAAKWQVSRAKDHNGANEWETVSYPYGEAISLNRAIVECVASFAEVDNGSDAAK